MGKQVEGAKKSKKLKKIQVEQDDEFSLSDQEPSKKSDGQPPAKNQSMKLLMDEVVKSQNTNSNTFLSSFTKPLERVKEEERKEKARRKEKPADNPAHKFISNAALEKELKSSTMRGVAKIMNMMSQYRKTHPSD